MFQATTRPPAIFLTLFLTLVTLTAPRPAFPQINSSYGPLPVFEFHSGFWINLHHTLYQEAKLRAGASNGASAPVKKSGPALKKSADPALALTAREQRDWDDAVNYYAANYAGKDLLFTTELSLLKNQLEDFDDCDDISGKKIASCNAGLAPRLTRTLEAAAAVYRAHQWPDHDRTNRRWILRAAPLVREQGVGLSERLADLYQTRWPREKIRVDVSPYAYSAGSYTTLEPLRVSISSTDARNQGAAALEVLFHEASHGIAEPVQQSIIRECRQREKAIPRDLWHALIFYTTRQVIRPLMPAGDAAANVVSSVPADSAIPANSAIPESGALPARAGAARPVPEDLYRRGWDDYYKLLAKFWQPYLDGRSTYDDAIARMVSAL